MHRVKAGDIFHDIFHNTLADMRCVSTSIAISRRLSQLGSLLMGKMTPHPHPSDFSESC